MPAMKVFACAIDYLRRHLLDMVTSRGLGMVNDDINWVLTVPAIWNEPSKQFMREAAVQVTLGMNIQNWLLGRYCIEGITSLTDDSDL